MSLMHRNDVAKTDIYTSGCSAEETLYHLMQKNNAEIASLNGSTASRILDVEGKTSRMPGCNITAEEPSQISGKSLGFARSFRGGSAPEDLQDTKTLEARSYSVNRLRRSVLQLMKQIRLLKSRIADGNYFPEVTCSATSFFLLRCAVQSKVIECHQRANRLNAQSDAGDADRLHESGRTSADEYSVQRRPKWKFATYKISKLENDLLVCKKQNEEYRLSITRNSQNLLQLISELEQLNVAVRNSALCRLAFSIGCRPAKRRDVP